MSEGPILPDSFYNAEIAVDNSAGDTTEAAADQATKNDRDLAAFEETIH